VVMTQRLYFYQPRRLDAVASRPCRCRRNKRLVLSMVKPLLITADLHGAQYYCRGQGWHSRRRRVQVVTNLSTEDLLLSIISLPSPAAPPPRFQNPIRSFKPVYSPRHCITAGSAGRRGRPCHSGLTVDNVGNLKNRWKQRLSRSGILKPLFKRGRAPVRIKDLLGYLQGDRVPLPFHRAGRIFYIGMMTIGAIQGITVPMN